jgi:crotonobetainyl-CoA:carnitine CoA-transferase CaiB-like acyl-CoA transferase
MTLGQRSGPLDDITIIDCTMAYAGPFGTVLLADLGANVIKVEPPGGDNFRPIPPFPPDYAHAWKAPAGVDYGMSFASVNRNKRSICLDFKDNADKEIFLQLCEQADAVVENMRSGVMDKLGLGYEVIAERNPKIVYGAVRGFGDPRTGASPYADWPCLDVAGQSMGGLVEATGDLFEVAIADIYPGTLMALGVVSAIHRAQKNGRGEFLDVAMYDAALSLLKSHVCAYSLTRKEQQPGNRALVPFGLFPASDGRIAIAAPVERHWQALCNAMVRPDLIDDKRTRSNPNRVRNRDFTEAQIIAWTSSRSKQQILELIGGRVPCGPANTMAEIFDDPHTMARDMIQPYQLPGDNPEVASAGNPIKFLGHPTVMYQAPPRLGEHTDDILAEFGITRTRKTQDEG